MSNHVRRPLLHAALVMGATFLLLAGPSARADDTEPFGVVLGERQLFLDDVGVEKITNLERSMHRPSKKGAVIRPNWHLGVTSVQVRTAAVWDADEKIFKLWDCAATPPDFYAAGKTCTGYYESQDGLHWSQPPLGQIDYDRWPKNNYISLVRPDGGHVRTDYIAYDPIDPDPSRRYKCALPPDGFAVSQDGRRWRWLPGVAGIPSGDEANFSFDRKARLFILTVKRGGPHGRSVYLATSKDFKSWTDHGLMFHADERDQKLGREAIEARFADSTFQPLVANDPRRYNVDVYNMGVFRYESLYIGTPTMYHATGPSADGSNTDGFHVVQLACSRDLKSWKRLGDRQPFIGNSRRGAGAYDLAGIIGPSDALVRGDELWFYYTSGKYRRSPERMDPDHVAISLAVLRRDGFVSLDADSAGGSVLTKSFDVPGPRLFVNVYAPKGELRVEVSDAQGIVRARSESLTGDFPRRQVEWREGGLDEIVGKTARLRFRLERAELYSYWFE